MQLAGPAGTAQTPPWELTKGPSGGYLLDLAIGDEDVIYLGTGGGGVFRSTNSGESWKHAGLAENSPSRIGVNHNGDVYAATPAGNCDLLFRSEDQGETWADTEIPCFFVTDLAFNNQGHVFVSANNGEGVYLSEDNGNTWVQSGLTGYPIGWLGVNEEDFLFAVSSDDGIFRSADNGLTWEYAGKPATYINNLLITAEGHLFVGANSGLFHSTDNGENWVSIPAFSGKETFALGAGNGCLFVRTDNLVAPYQTKIHRSSDDGLTWEEIGFPGFCCPLEFAFNQNGHLFTFTFSGIVLKSVDNGDTWAEIQAGMANGPVTGLGANKTGLLAAALWCEGIALSTDQGETWENQKTLLEQMAACPRDISVNDSGHIFAFGWQLGPMGLFRSLNEGDTWSPLNVPSFRMAPFINGSGHLFVGGYEGNVWHSVDNGDTWSPLGPGIESYAIQTVAAGENGEIFAGCFSGIIFRTLDGGANWENIPVADTAITALACNGQGLVLAGTESGSLFRSGDFGATWVQTASLSSSITDIVIKNEDDIVAATVAHGCFASGDGGNTWFSFNNGLVNPYVHGLAIDGNGVLFAGTGGNGVFRNTSEITSVKSLPDDGRSFATLGQNFPNPFSHTTRIPFTLTRRSDVRLDVFDINGKRVETLFDATIPPGVHASVWDAAGMPAGVYLYQLKTEEGVVVRKCILQNH